MASNLDAVLKLEAPIIVEIGRRQLPLRRVLGLTPGAILELPKPVDEELELKVNNKTIGAGTAVKVGENFGLKITFIGDVRSRIEALGGADAAQGASNNDNEQSSDQGEASAEQNQPARQPAERPNQSEQAVNAPSPQS